MAALFALVLAALLPSAVMATARPGETLVLCTAEGPRTISLDDDQAPPAVEGSACAACVLVHPAVLPEPPRSPVAAVPTLAIEARWTANHSRPQPPSRTPSRPPSTAPPLA